MTLSTSSHSHSTITCISSCVAAEEGSVCLWLLTGGCALCVAHGSCGCYIIPVPAKQIKKFLRVLACVRGRRAGRAGHPWQTTDSARKNNADRNAGAGEGGKEAVVSIKKTKRTWKKSHKCGGRAKVTLVRSRWSKWHPIFCISGHGCWPSSNWLKRKRVASSGGSHWHGPEWMGWSPGASSAWRGTDATGIPMGSGWRGRLAGQYKRWCWYIPKAYRVQGSFVA